MPWQAVLVTVVLFGLGCGDDGAGDDAGAIPGASNGAATDGGGADPTAGRASSGVGGNGVVGGNGASGRSGNGGSGRSGNGASGSGSGNQSDGGGSIDAGNQGGSGGGGPPVVDGWTEFEMQPGAQVIYVSSSGSDGAPGTMDEPKATIQGAYDAVRDGEPDWVLFKRGDQWTRTEAFPWFKSGPSADDTGFMRIGAYGDESLPRPRIDSGQGGGLVLSPGYQAMRPLTHVAVTDIHFIAAGRIAAGAAAGPDAIGIQSVAVEYMGSSDPLRGVVIENVRLEGFGFGMSIGHDMRDLKIRRCIFTDIFSPGGDGTNGSAILTDAADVLIEDNVFYRIQHPDNPAVTAISSMAHSAYLGAGGRNMVSRGNIIIKATEGFMQRPGGVFERNVAVTVQIAHLSGQAWGVTPTAGGVTATVRDNLLLNAASSMILGNTASGSVSGNMIVRGPEGTASPGIDLVSENAAGSGTNIGVHDTAFEGNVMSGDITYNAGDSQSFSGLTFSNNRPNRGAIETTIASFVTSVGLDGDIDDYAADLIARDRSNFSARHLSKAMLDFYREAEDLPPLP